MRGLIIYKMEYKLNCIHDGRKSFYNKALIIEAEGIKKLQSYETIVCIIKNNKPIVYGTYSQTTLRHIKEFLIQNGFKAESSSQILKDYSPTEEDKKEEEEEKENSNLKMISSIASLGNLFCDNQKDKNDWKARMIKAGLENKGLIMPEDWENLKEDEKEVRLNGIIKILGEDIK